jgi:PAS domain S-box-containing protein
VYDHHSDGSPLAELVGEIGLHDHLCIIYETQNEQLAAAIPFLKIGLERGEKCVYIADSNTTALMKAMREQEINVDAAVREGRLTITNKEIYPLRGDFVPDRWIELIDGFVRDAKAAGFSALRLMGEMSWVAKTDPRPERLIEYEAKFNHFVHEHDISGICQYDARLFQPEVLLNVLRTHPTVVYGGSICENPYYVPADEFLGLHDSRREIQRMLARMREDTASKEKLRQSEADLAEAQRVARLGSWKFNLADDSVTWSEEVYRIFEVDKAEFRGVYESFLSNVHPDDRERVLQTNRVAREGGGPFEVEYRIVTKAGVVKNVREVGYVTKDANGNVLRLFGTVQDITDYKRAQEELQKLSGRLLQLQDEERGRIGRDLHDSTGQDLVALATMLGQLRGSVSSRDRKSRKLLSECQALADRCIREVRTLSYLLHPPVLDQAGLVDAIRDYVKGFTKRSGIHVGLELSANVGRMPREVELALFRVVQEALANIQRHSGSQHAKIHMDRNANLVVEISDSGRGASGSLPRRLSEPPFQLGVGIPSMQERVKLIGGRLEIDSTSSGTTVRVTVPLGGGSEKPSHSLS